MNTNVIPNVDNKNIKASVNPTGTTGQRLLYYFEPPMPQNHWELIQFMYVHLLQTTARAYTAERIDSDVRAEAEASLGNARDVCEFFGVDVGHLETALLRKWAKDDDWLAAKMAKYLSKVYLSANRRLWDFDESSGLENRPPHPGGFYNPLPEDLGGAE